MKQEPKVSLLTDSQNQGGQTPPDKKIDFPLRIGHHMLNLTVAFEDRQIRLADIVPAARQISQKICLAILEDLLAVGKQIPCHRGCDACCRKCLVPISVPEAFRIREEIFKMPLDQRQAVLQSCLVASRKILNRKPPETFLNQATGGSIEDSIDIQSISNWYETFNLSCAFLRHHQCLIYQNRPLACREHFVTGSRPCSQDSVDDTHPVELPLTMTEILGVLAASLEDTEVEAVIMPLMPVWYLENSRRDQKTWPAKQVVDTLLDIIAQKTYSEPIPSATSL